MKRVLSFEQSTPKRQKIDTLCNTQLFGKVKMAGGGGGRLIRVFNVAEKHSVARDVSGILARNHGGLRMRDGRSVYNKIFEFIYEIQGHHCQMIFTSIHGHLMELEFDDRYRKWHSCDPVDLYQAPVRKYVPEVSIFVLLCVYLYSLRSRIKEIYLQQ